MRLYILNRLLSTIPVLLIVSVVVFVILYIAPGDPALTMLGSNATQEEVERLREQLGLNAPLFQQYITWLAGVLRGDFGVSVFTGEPVFKTILEHLGPSFSLAVLSLLIGIIIAIPLGIMSARRKGTMADQTFMTFSLLGQSVPSFVLALFLVLIFAVQFRWLPVAGYASLSDGLLNHLKYLILPSITIGAYLAALIARMTRSAMIESLQQNYILTARSKGLVERKIVYKHALRNAAIQIFTVLGQSFGLVITGAALVETIFNIPGFGQLLVNSVIRRDFTVIQGTVVFITLLYVLINLSVDLLYGWIDPRVRLNRK